MSAAAVVRQKAKREITFGSERKRWSCFLSQICLSAWRWMLLFRNSAQQKYNVVACHAEASVCFRLFGPGGVCRLSLWNSRHVWVRTTASALVSPAGRPLLCLTVNHVCFSALNICLWVRPDLEGSANLSREGVGLLWSILTRSYCSLSFPSPLMYVCLLCVCIMRAQLSKRMGGGGGAYISRDSHYLYGLFISKSFWAPLR